MRTFVYVLFLAFVCLQPIQAQLSGTYSVPASFTTLAAAINSLNAAGVSGSVNIEIAAGYTETIPAGGYTLYSLSGASATSQVTFRKNGAGANPILYAYSTGTNYAYTYTQDGMFWLLGADYVTIDGIDLVDPNLSNPATMEVGYGLFKPNGNDGCQHNTIRNCVVTLKRVNGDATNIYAVDGSRGIQLANSLPSAYYNPSAPTVTVFAGTNSYNSIYSNTVQNCHSGIAVCGTVSAISLTVADIGNEIGGLLPGMGNVIINFGGGGTGDATGIATAYQTSVVISGNYINNNNGGGLNGSADLRGLHIQDCSGVNTAVITNNTITLKGGGVNFNHFGIETWFGSSFSNAAVVTISNNLITGGTYTNTSYGPFKGIAYNGVSGTLCVVSNTISNMNFAGSGTVTLIQPSGNGTVTSNLISGITYSATAGDIRGIQGGRLVNSNIIESIGLTAPSSTGNINGCFGANTSGSITLNTFRNFYAAGLGTVCGVNYLSGSTVTIAGNSIYNFSTTSGGPGSTTLTGITLSAANAAVTSNTIYGLYASGTATNALNLVQGIAIYSSTLNTISRNKMFDLSATGSGGRVYAIHSPTTIPLGSFPVNYIVNNLIGELSAPNSVGANQVSGLNIVRSSTNIVYYNSIHINASSTGSLFGSSAVSFSATGVQDMRNNILVNISTPSGSGKTVVYLRSAPVFSTYATASNNNLLYAGIPSSSRLIFSDGNSNCVSLGDYKFYAWFRDHSSVTELPPFVSTSGSSPSFLSIGSASTQVEGGALPIAGYSTDITGSIRNSSNPDIGAWEGNWNAVDLLPPSLQNAAFTQTSSCNYNARTYTIALGDASGVATGSLAPRLYYRVNSGTYTSVGGSLTAGSNTMGIWTFGMTYTSVPTDIIQYFFVAQDQSTTQNIMAMPSAGFSAANVNSIITPPSAPMSYSVMYNLAGTYSVGAGETFTTLTQAVSAYNYGCLAGPVIYVLTNGSYNQSQENFPITFLANPDASSTNSLLIRPQSAVYVSISSGSVSSSTLKFMGARYIALDGLNTPSTALSVSQGTTNFWNSSVIWLASQGTVTGNSDLTFKRLYIYSNYIGINSSRHDTLSRLGGVNNNNIRIEGNQFYKGTYGIYGAGTGYYLPYPGTISNWTVANNYFGGAGTLSVSFTSGIFENINNLVFKGNSILNVKQLGIGGERITGADISYNLFTNITGTNSTSAAIRFGDAVNSMTVSHNTIRDTYGEGIQMFQTYSTTATNYIRNNMISGIRPGCNTCGITGISLAMYSTIEVDHNTVNLAGTSTASATYTYPVHSAALEVQANYLGAVYKFRNNILVNNYYIQNATNQGHFAFYAASATSNVAVPPMIVAMDRNDYYCGGSGGKLGYNQGTNITTLAGMQTVFGGNINSVSMNPVFTASNDPHIAIVSGNLQLENLGAPLVGITNDIDGQIRSTTSPDIGADEFFIPVCLSANSGTILTSSLNICAAQPVSLSSSGTSGAINEAYQWQVATTPGGTYTNVTTGTNTLYTMPGASSGSYYYRLMATCTSGTNTSIQVSNIATVVVNPNPTITITGQPTLCYGSATTLSASGAVTYSWGSGGTGSVAVASPTANGPFSVTGWDTNNCSGTSLISLSVSPLPTIGVNSGSLCTGGNFTISPFGAATYSITGGIFIVSPLNTTSYSVTGQSTSGCVSASVAVASVSVVQSPTIGVSSGTTCSGTAFTITPVGGPFFGGTPVFTVASTNATINGTGSAVVSPTTSTQYSVFALGLAACISNTAIATITVSALPLVSAPGGSICSGQVFTISPSGALNFTISGGSNTVSPVSNTNYSVTGTSTAGCVSASPAIVSVVVFSLPIVSVSSYTTCLGKQVVISPSGAQTYSITGGTSIVSPTVNSSYSITGTSNQGCESSSQVVSTVSVFPNPTISVNSATICEGKTVAIVPSGAFTYSITGNNFTVSPLVSGMYTVSGSYANGCTAVNPAIAFITVKPAPVITVNNGSICAGSSHTFSPVGALSYSFQGGSAVVSPAVSTSYSIAGTGSNACVGSTTGIVTIFPPSNISIHTTDSVICVGEKVVLTASGASGYTWTPNGSGPTVSFTPQTTTNYTVIAMDVNGCFASAVFMQYVDPCTNVNRNELADSFSLWPNPNKGHFSFECGEQNEVIIYDLTGRIIYAEKFSAGYHAIDLGPVASGCYVINIIFREQQHISKLVVSDK